MRFFIINTDYQDYIDSIYSRNPGLRGQSFSEQYDYRMNSLFGMADFYSRNLNALGHEAVDIIANHEPLQRQWAVENGVKVSRRSWLRFPVLRRVVGRENWMYPILEEQIERFRPDVIYSMAMESVPSDFLKSVKTRYGIKLIVGQHAAPLTRSMADLSGYDLILSSLPNLVRFFREKGGNSEYFQLGFEATIPEGLSKGDEQHQVVFVGGISGAHSRGTEMMERLARSVPIDFWGYGIDSLPSGSRIKRSHHGMIWGKDMYNLLYNARIGINRHIDISENYANNMRLYETTGVGTLLITDYKDNLNDIFEIGKEVEIYHNERELIEKIGYYLENEGARDEIARAGQRLSLIHI